MKWTDPETWIVLSLAFGMGAGLLRGGQVLRHSLRPGKRRKGPESLEPEPYQDEDDTPRKRSPGPGSRHSE